MWLGKGRRFRALYFRQLFLILKIFRLLALHFSLIKSRYRAQACGLKAPWGLPGIDALFPFVGKALLRITQRLLFKKRF